MIVVVPDESSVPETVSVPPVRLAPSSVSFLLASTLTVPSLVIAVPDNGRVVERQRDVALDRDGALVQRR